MFFPFTGSVHVRGFQAHAINKERTDLVELVSFRKKRMQQQKRRKTSSEDGKCEIELEWGHRHAHEQLRMERV